MKLARSVLPSCGSVFRSSVLLLLVMPLLSVPSYADILTVPGDYGTIQAAVDASADGDEIIVSPGTYVENIIFNGHGENIILRSTDPTDPDVVANTIIDGSHDGPVVYFRGTETPGCTLLVSQSPTEKLTTAGAYTATIQWQPSRTT